MTTNPYFLPPRSVVSFSGGRTSGYMLDQILNAHDGVLPDDRVVVFCNTGKEREETLEFVDEFSRRRVVKIYWLEYHPEPTGEFGGKYGNPLWNHTFRIVDFKTASRNGEPFKACIKARNMLPNPVTRFCTGDLKIKTTSRFVRQHLGWDEYDNAVGLRRDEPGRALNLLALPLTEFTPRMLFDEMDPENPESGSPPGEEARCPLYDAGATLEDVMVFWQEQRGGMELTEWLALPKAERPGWDLGLEQDEGNCDLCFLKGTGKILRIIQKIPSSVDWWAEAEAKHHQIRSPGIKLFRKGRPSYSELRDVATGKVSLPLWDDMDTLPCRCAN